MKQSFKSARGVTLLEIMLVLAIAAMVVVMSIRYYQTASLNQKVASTMNNIVGVVAAGESYFSATNSASGISSTTLAPYMPGSAMPNSAWGGLMTATGSASVTNQFTIDVPNVPAAGCSQIKNLLSSNSKLSTSAACTTAGTMTINVTM